MKEQKKRLVEGGEEDGEDIALLSDHFFVVEDSMDTPDRYLIVRRDADYSAQVVARFKDFDYAHFCAKKLSEYAEKYKFEDEPD